MDNVRTRRIAELLKHELAEIVKNDINDPRVHDVVFTRVKVSKDIGIAWVYFTSYKPENLLDIRIGLDKSKGFIRKKLMEAVHMKKLPQLIFEKDETPEDVAKLDEIFKQIKPDNGN